MPLKHATETFLVFLLGFVILLVGFLLPTLPDLPAGAVPWAILFLLAILYPLSLFFLFRHRRADHSFRLLHWYPALMLLVWLGCELLALWKGRLLLLLDWYLWAWTLPAIAIAFVFLITYCLQVVRRRGVRIALLLLAFIPYVGVALASVESAHWERQVATVLWGGEWLQALEGKEFLGLRIAQRFPLQQNLSSSQDQSEESWRERLREAEQRRREVRELLRRQSGSSLFAFESPVQAGSSASMRDTRTKPEHLPSSGPEGLGAFLLLFVAAYTAVLHERARRRV